MVMFISKLSIFFAFWELAVVFPVVMGLSCLSVAYYLHFFEPLQGEEIFNSLICISCIKS